MERRLIELSRVNEELTRKASESDQKIVAYEKSVKNLESMTDELKSKAEQQTEQMVFDPIKPNTMSQVL